MYASRISPLHRLRQGRESSSSRMATSPKRKAPVAALPNLATASPRLSGDYQVLRSMVNETRQEVRQSRTALASALDRLGEHHVRQKEYDDAMDAFTEALHEKRSIFTAGSDDLCSSGYGHSSVMSDCEDQSPEVRDQAIDQIILTLRNMGNVHSLRGEQDEAMRYYTEVTNLKASKANVSVAAAADDATTLLSGLGGGDEDNSTLMSEINEDVKALDDMFRSISFRNQEISAENLRKAKSLAARVDISNPSSKRRRGENDNGNLTGLESEPFQRSTSTTFSLPANGNDLTDALDLCKNVIDAYDGPNLEHFKETLNSLALRVDLLTEDLKRSDSAANAGGNSMELELTLEIFQHLLTVQHEMNSTGDDQPNLQLSSNIASTLIRMGSVYYKLGNRLEELRMYNEAKDTYCKAFGETHSFVAGARKNIGMVLAERGEYEGAIDQFEKAKQIYLEVNGGSEMSRNVASAISCMGNVKNRVGELDTALERYMEALHIYKSVQEDALGSEGAGSAIRDVTATLKVIGMVHAKRGNLDLAMSFFQEAMALLRSTGVEATSVGRETSASILTRIASIYAKKGELGFAMEHYREAYEVTVRNRGTTNHQDVAGILHYIGGILHKKGEYNEAMDCYQEAIRIYHSTLGPGNPTVAGTLVMIGSIHYKKRNLDGAMMFYREALRLNRDAYGMHHPDIAPILKSIGTILTKKGEYHEAYEIFRDVLSIKCTIHGTCHPDVANAYKSLGNVHYKLGELADAERQYRHALNIYRRTRGEEHVDTIAARTTIDHIRYWMKERGQRDMENRHSRSSARSQCDDERSC